ncbi:LytR/AlgR family response regulator transcription factor [Mesobacillus foraminis]|uniref:LytR/AlgR family response regulator transcription factor n=1 Tax=Mesobacillus foraminis TaxID=279826 RepID=UPI000EF4B931|nr:LytTR family DNA-binding domain-containing protein [Mesobacillus foraminis]
MIEAYIVEDELYAREDLIDSLHNSREIKVIGESEDIEKALWEIHQLKPEVVFLDIHLVKGDGMELAAQLKSLKEPPLIIFVTAYENYASKAFDLDAVDYILKPFDEKRITQTIEKIIKWKQIRRIKGPPESRIIMDINKTVNKLAVSKDDRFILVDIHSILYIGTENRQVFVKTEKEKYLIDTPLYEAEQKLQKYSFLRVHRGFLINLEYVIEIEPWFNGTYNLIFSDGSKAPVSRSHIKTVRKFLGF